MVCTDYKGVTTNIYFGIFGYDCEQSTVQFVRHFRLLRSFYFFRLDMSEMTIRCFQLNVMFREGIFKLLRSPRIDSAVYGTIRQPYSY